ncbi:hypothetical protein L2K70_04275 [Nocardioides KLBMP 9356]|uniref:WD40 repeat domain-containing protein n=1 Tax=Nocardioides potassii TaxID=2911371 RepID=A0ABS9H966_9ACTN|nr:hypothetical protein [Nocardioides potassii]MCF6376812.1 hypothetical protein [Nocardioides potassii]
MRHLHIPGLIALLGATLLATPAGAHPSDHHARTTVPAPTTATVATDQLGPDSVLAVVAHGRFDVAGARGLERSLEVITADGTRHPVWTVAVRQRRGWLPGDFVLRDWRPEMHTALLRVSRGPDGDTLVSYDVTTGATRQVPAPERASTTGLAPDGSGVLMTTYGTPRRAGRVGVLAWDGSKEWLPAQGDGAAITSADGQTLVTTDAKSWWISDLASRTSRRVEVDRFCTPVRWADADSVVATCSAGRGSQLRRVDLDGSSVPLGVRHATRTARNAPPILSDGDVRTVQGRDYYESFGGCGGAVLTRQGAAGEVRVVRVPGDRGALSLVGTRGDDLVIAHIGDDCGSPGARSVLSLFDPVSKDETHLTVLPRRESWSEVLAAAEVRSWIG